MRNALKMIIDGSYVEALVATAEVYMSKPSLAGGDLVTWADEYSDNSNFLPFGVGVFIDWLPETAAFYNKENGPTFDRHDCRIIALFNTRDRLPKSGVQAMPAARLRRINKKEAEEIIGNYIHNKAKKDFDALQAFLSDTTNVGSLKPNIKVGDICIDDDGDHLVCLEEPKENHGDWTIEAVGIAGGAAHKGVRGCTGVRVLTDAEVRNSGVNPDIIRHLLNGFMANKPTLN